MATKPKKPSVKHKPKPRRLPSRASIKSNASPKKSSSRSSGIIAFAADHAGFELKEILKKEISELGYKILDLGTNSDLSVDYPDYGNKIAEAVTKGKASLGVAICGSGIGISIAANRHKGARAALCHDGLSARLARMHNDANILALGSRLTGIETAKDILQNFLSTPFEGGRHQKRVDKL